MLLCGKSWLQACSFGGGCDSICCGEQASSGERKSGLSQRRQNKLSRRIVTLGCGSEFRVGPCRNSPRPKICLEDHEFLDWSM